MKHIERIKNPDAVVEGEYKCKNCIKTYKSNQGLWAHKKVCVAPEPIVAAPETDLHAKIDDLHTEIDNLKGMIIGLVNNQQPAINNTINNDNSVSIDNSTKNYINVFLNDKCGNACDIEKFIA